MPSAQPHRASPLWTPSACSLEAQSPSLLRWTPNHFRSVHYQSALWGHSHQMYYTGASEISTLSQYQCSLWRYSHQTYHCGTAALVFWSVICTLMLTKFVVTGGLAFFLFLFLFHIWFFIVVIFTLVGCLHFHEF